MRVPVRSSLLAAALVVGMCNVAYAQPYRSVPPLRREVIPVAPGPRFIWEPGHWVWSGHGYAWAGGRYVQRRPNYTNYHPGRWANRSGRWVWVAPGWG